MKYNVVIIQLGSILISYSLGSFVHHLIFWKYHKLIFSLKYIWYILMQILTSSVNSEIEKKTTTTKKKKTERLTGFSINGE